MPFHYLDLLETQTAQLLDSRKHILCVYGDNWINSVKLVFLLSFLLISFHFSSFIPFFRYAISFLPIDDRSMEDFTNIQELEKELSSKKSEMTRFQIEYTNAKKKYVVSTYI